MPARKVRISFIVVRVNSSAPCSSRLASLCDPGKRLRVLSSAGGQALRNRWRRFKPLLSPLRKVAKSFRAETLPADANQPLFAAFCRLVGRRLPILALMAGDRALHAERFDYLDVALRGSNSSVARHYLADTNHSFSEGNGKSDVIKCMFQWLGTMPFVATGRGG